MACVRPGESVVLSLRGAGLCLTQLILSGARSTLLPSRIGTMQNLLVWSMAESGVGLEGLVR